MAETLRIEIPIETIDETEPELTNVTKKIEKLGKEAEEAGSRTKKSSEYITKFDAQAEKTERSLAQWAKEKYEVLLEAKDTVSPVLSTLGTGLRSFAGKTWNVTMRAVDLVTAPVRGILNLLKNPLFQAGAVLGVSVGLKDTIDTYKDFEAAMSQVQAISGASGPEKARLTDKAKEMGACTKFTAEESAEAFNYMAMAGWKTDDMLGGILGILSLAAASGEDLATTSDIVTDGLTAFQMQADEAGHFSDVLAVAASSANTSVSEMGETFKYVGAMAGALGYKVEDVALATGLMANQSIRGSMAGTSLNAMLTRLATDTNGARKAVEKLGIEFFDDYGNARPLVNILGELRTATEGYTDEQKANLANTIAGMEAQKGLLAILNTSEEDYTKLAEAVYNADGAAADMADTMQDNLQGALTRLQSAVDGVKISFGERLSPYVKELAEWLTGQMPVIEDGISKFMDMVDSKIDHIRRKFREISGTEEWKEAGFFGKVKIAWNELIAEPFSEWWNSTGKAKFAGYAQDIGSGIGVGLKAGIMTLLGIDISETVDEGVSIGASFARGFSEGFDFEAVSQKLWQGFGNLATSALTLLPGGEAADLSSVMSAVMLWKTAGPVVRMGAGLGKGIFGAGRMLFGKNADTGVSLMGSLLGSTGNAVAGGSGILGGLADIGYKLTGGGSAAGGAMSGGMAALSGAGAVTGGVVAGATLISGAMDAYTAMKSEDEDESKAYAEAAGWKIGGVATGAALGAAFGSVIPGLGTAFGALIGGGVGGIAGWVRGNKFKEEYHENVEQMQKEAEKAQKVFDATGRSIDEVTFKNKELEQAMNDTGVSASQFALMFQEECAKVAKDAFGDISLSLAEVKKLAGEITFGSMAEELGEFADAVSDTEAALGSLEASVSGLKKANWKVGLGMELSEEDMDSYRSTVDAYLTESMSVIESQHYEASVALKLLLGEDADTSGLDDYYGGLRSQLEDLGTQMAEVLNAALEDNVITPDEMASLENLQDQIAEITNEMAEARAEAEMETLQVKYNGAALDADSFRALQEELIANAALASEQYEDALTVTLTNLNRRELKAGKKRDAGLMTEEEYQLEKEDIQRQKEEAREGYYAGVNEANERVTTFSLESIASAFGEKLDGFMPEVEGTLAEKLQTALNNAILAHPDINTWEAADLARWIGLDKLDLDPADQDTIAADLILTALAVQKGTKETLLEEFKDQVPTAEEIMEAIDWDDLTNNQLNEILIAAGVVTSDGGARQADMPLSDWVERSGENYDDYKDRQAERIRQALEESGDNELVSLFREKYMSGTDAWKEAGAGYGDMFNEGLMESIEESSPLIRTVLQSVLDTAAENPFVVSPTVQVTPEYQVNVPERARPSVGNTGGYMAETHIGYGASPAQETLPKKSTGSYMAEKHTGSGASGTASGAPAYHEGVPERARPSVGNTGGYMAETHVGAHAAGGYVSGGPQLSWLAEEGYGEFIIPTNPSRRARALELYAQAGAALGVSAHASGGYAGGSILSDMASDYHLSHEINRNAPLPYNETTEGNYNGETDESYTPAPAAVSGNAGGITVQVSVKAEPEYVIHAGSGQGEEDIMQVIRRHMKEMADELGGEIAAKLEEAFSNMPLKEA